MNIYRYFCGFKKSLENGQGELAYSQCGDCYHEAYAIEAPVVPMRHHLEIEDILPEGSACFATGILNFITELRHHVISLVTTPKLNIGVRLNFEDGLSDDWIFSWT